MDSTTNSHSVTPADNEELRNNLGSHSALGTARADGASSSRSALDTATPAAIIDEGSNGSSVPPSPAGGAPDGIHALVRWIRLYVGISSHFPDTLQTSANELWKMVFRTNIDVDVESRRYLPLYKAAMKGDWESANSFIREDNTAPTARISIYEWTALHVACGQGHSKFVEKLIQYMPTPEALSLQDNNGCTALHYAATAGSFGCVEALLRMNPGLAQIANIGGNVPLIDAAKIPTSGRSGQKEVVWQLCLATRDEGPHSPFVSPAIFQLFNFLIANEYLDIAFYLVRRYPFLAAPGGGDKGLYGLHGLIQYVPSVFESQSRLGFWESIIACLFSVPLELDDIVPEPRLRTAEQRNENADAVPFCSRLRAYINSVLKHIRLWLRRSICIVPGLSKIYEEKSKHVYARELVKVAFSHASTTLNNDQMLALLLRYDILHGAAEHGVVEIFKTCFEFFPDSIWFPTQAGPLLQVSIKYRQEKIFNFLLETMAKTEWLGISSSYVEDEDTTLHFVAKLAPFAKLKAISGSALQMQSELQWFKAAEKLIHPFYRLMKDSKQRTPQKLFTEEHEALLKSGEKWMKNTASSSMLVSTLIATVVFAAAFKVPGGNNPENGLPLFLQNTSFLIFAVSDALALFSSATSILMFLSILTSRFGEEDFLVALPRKLIIGLASLFFAIVTMMIAFGATFVIELGHRFPRQWIAITAVSLPACIPVALFMMLQLPLFIQIVKSTFWSNIPWR